jgi:hypothetical protein
MYHEIQAGYREAVTAHKRTEITIQTDQVVLIRRRVRARRWCPECGSEVDVVDLVQSQALTVAQARLNGGTQARKWHYLEGPDGTPLVCLESLLGRASGHSQE